jgi:radical SAM superfamily enzyme YgiQ (UPF0313 family)
MIDLLLVNPKTSLNIENNEPLNLMSLAAYLLRHGVSVEIHDEMRPRGSLAQAARGARYVGITANTCSYPRAARLAGEVRRLAPEAILIAGGVHPTTMPRAVLDDGFDLVVEGEGERALLQIIGSGEREGIFRGEPITDEELYRPARQLVDMAFYARTKIRCPHDPNLNFIPYGRRMACFLTSRGCPYGCIFCHNIWRRTKLRFFPLERVLEELAWLKREHGASAIWLMDDHIFINKRRARELFTRMIDERLGLIWASSTRADAVDDELLELAHRSGCRRLALGAESGSQRVLERLEKRLSVERNLEAIRLCRKHRIRTLITIMIGNPGETLEDVRRTMEFILSSRTDDLAISILTPFPGTKLWQWCEEQGRIPPEAEIDFSQFNYLKAPVRITDAISPRRLETLKRNMLIRFYLQPHQALAMARKFLANPRSMYDKIIEYF